MSSFNFSPILSQVGFYTHSSVTPNYLITTPLNVSDFENLYISFSLQGIEYTVPPKELAPEDKPSFYINVALLNQRGGKDLQFKNYSHHVTTSKTNEDDGSFSLVIELLNQSSKSDSEFYFNLVDLYLSCIIFHSSDKITSEEEFFSHIRDPYYILYNSKVPIVGGL